MSEDKKVANDVQNQIPAGQRRSYEIFTLNSKQTPKKTNDDIKPIKKKE